MKKEVAVITRAKAIRGSMKEQLDNIFGELINCSIYSLEDESIKDLKKSDLYVITTSAYELIDKKLFSKENSVVVDYSIFKEKVNFLKSFPSGTKAVLFNVTLKMCFEVISLLYHLGVNNIEFIPGYPNMKEFPETSLIITPAESKLIPQNLRDREIIDIGHRILDAGTIIEIALKLEFEHILYYKKIKEYLGKVATNDYSLTKILEKAIQSESQLDILIETLKIGIIGVDKDNYICLCNESAEKILEKNSDALIGNNAEEMLKDIPFETIKKDFKEIKSKLITINGEYINLNAVPIVKHGNYMGAFAILQKFKEEEIKQHELRRQIVNRGHSAKYTFDDILGESTSMKRLKDIAKKMAKTNSAVLITGESGTGKELFSHAIHNYSERREYPFVAINCAAIPDNLLESELFGYEEGAFTGAKRGGKIGLFEFAHMGTLLLDEIEGMSPALQIKLLRVIQEKEIMRIGGNKVINIDVRIIATTNEDLRVLIQDGKFRKDLYYRINTLPIMIPSLKDREDDVYLLLEKFKGEVGAEFTFDSKATEALKLYNWDGNIRELKNYVEFFNFMGEKVITFDDLPVAIKEYYNEIKGKIKEKENNELQKIAGNRYNEYIFLLKKIELLSIAGESCGRKKLQILCEKNGVNLSEQEIRTGLKDLEKIGFINVYKGRRGSSITEKGKAFLDVL